VGIVETRAHGRAWSCHKPSGHNTTLLAWGSHDGRHARGRLDHTEGARGLPFAAKRPLKRDGAPQQPSQPTSGRLVSSAPNNILRILSPPNDDTAAPMTLRREALPL
jgi:hypothetical protein